ncbi:MAG: hypothetical protein WKF35_06615 [Ferruginibacter sp.]
MDILDFLVFFVYIIIFYFLFKLRRNKYADPVLRKYHRDGFWIKIFSSFAYCMFTLYVSRGDTNALYFPEGLNFYNLILKDLSNIYLLFVNSEDFDQTLLYDPWNMGYLTSKSNLFVAQLVGFLSFLTLGKFMAINLFFSMISFTGVWRLFLFFYEQYPRMHKAFAISIIYLPTFVFWSSGILKDPLCTGALGWFTYSFYHLFYNKKNWIKDAVIACIAAYVLWVLKVYIIVSYLPFFMLFLILKNVELIKSNFAKVMLVLTFIIGSMIGFTQLSGSTDKALGGFASKGLTKSIATYQTNYINQQTSETSSFSLGVEYDGSMGSLLSMAPAAITATLYRPYIWESRKVSTLISSVESLLFMLFTIFVIYKVGIKGFFVTIIRNPIIIYCLLFSLVFALFVGATTLNFGTLVRYKIPEMPFYLISLFLILYFNPKAQKRPGNVPGPVVSEM